MSDFVDQALELAHSIVRHYYRWDSLRFVLSPGDCASVMRATTSAYRAARPGITLLTLQTTSGEAEITLDHEILDGQCLVLWVVDRVLWHVRFEIDRALPDVAPEVLLKKVKILPEGSTLQMSTMIEPSSPDAHSAEMEHEAFAARMRARRGDRPLPEVRTIGLAGSPMLPLDTIFGASEGPRVLPGEFLTIDEVRRMRGLPPLATAVLDETLQSLGLTRHRNESNASIRERLVRITGVKR
jgi:hypothetical protein